MANQEKHQEDCGVGGKLSALEEHIAAMKLNSLFEGTDFKLASCYEPSNDRVAKECGFTSLSIRTVNVWAIGIDPAQQSERLHELVTLSSCPLPRSPEISNAGKHLSASEFHSVLHNVGNSQDKLIPSSNRGTVLIDARNLFETRIGKFCPPNVETLDPEIRQYSDLPSWIDNNSDKLRGNNILMYSTGGIRCEMASAYIRSKGAGFGNVFQLYGGIQRYLEQFPDGGFFRGKNFVFDHRRHSQCFALHLSGFGKVSVGSSESRILGTFLLCSSPFDDYSSQSRCTYCRMLVLVCDNCRALIQTMLYSKLFPDEGMLSAKFEYECRVRGAQRMAFNPVVGGRLNGSVIHYSRNDKKIEDGNLVLMDVGCELHGYVSDLTRTWPPFRKFSPVHEELYDLILETNKECVELCRPGTSIREIHHYSFSDVEERQMHVGCLSLNLKIVSLLPISSYVMNGNALVKISLETVEGRITVQDMGSSQLNQEYTSLRALIVQKGSEALGLGLKMKSLLQNQVLTASIPKEIKHLESLLNNFGSGSGMESRAALS
ncbi:hypothetical protein RND71_041216 [Anisodus tanguticus]|uniref:Rhodanese domain-containing protein n=1 Tax=Anisodus tanguticus TaxID=243964 RepID=A0AAE1QV06_9SOLA|nr:hypothetical protein RND71_041216 [Anisodus tanguticus]